MRDYKNRVYCQVHDPNNSDGGYISSIPIWSLTPDGFEIKRREIFTRIIQERDPFQRGLEIEMKTAYLMIGRLD